MLPFEANFKFEFVIEGLSKITWSVYECVQVVFEWEHIVTTYSYWLLNGHGSILWLLICTDYLMGMGAYCDHLFLLITMYLWDTLGTLHLKPILTFFPCNRIKDHIQYIWSLIDSSMMNPVSPSMPWHYVITFTQYSTYGLMDHNVQPEMLVTLPHWWTWSSSSWTSD